MLVRASRILLAVLVCVSVPNDAHAADAGDGGAVFLLVLGLAFIVIYSLPTMIAFSKGHPNRWVILALNMFLGSTGIVWLICLIWALHAVHAVRGVDGARTRGGESGLNIFANDEKKIRIVNQLNTEPRSVAVSTLPDLASQITRLKQLFDSGAISRAEFDDLKRKLIGW